jgi:hypothetical protein
MSTAHTPEEIKAAIDRYEAGADRPRQAMAGLTREQMTARPVAGAWSIQEIILHLMDSDLIASDRMKRIASEHRPLLVNYDESAFARTMGYQAMDADLACQVFAINRRMTAAMLRQLPAEAFSRAGVHNVNGLRTLMDLVRGYHDHLEHHLKFAREKRAMVGG